MYTTACNRLAGAAFFGPGSASGNGSISNLRHGEYNRSGRHSITYAIIRATSGVPQRAWWGCALQAGDAAELLVYGTAVKLS